MLLNEGPIPEHSTTISTNTTTTISIILNILFLFNSTSTTIQSLFPTLLLFSHFFLLLFSHTSSKKKKFQFFFIFFPSMLPRPQKSSVVKFNALTTQKDTRNTQKKIFFSLDSTKQKRIASCPILVLLFQCSKISRQDFPVSRRKLVVEAPDQSAPPLQPPHPKPEDFSALVSHLFF